MNEHSTPGYAADVPPASIQQWQWEESINSLRRQATEDAVERHWSSTGQTAIDATARAHIAEWLVVDAAEPEADPSVPIIDALVHRALADEPWDLYVVERHDGSTMAVRRLRDQRGFTLRWLEGRTPPPVETTVALRLVHLDPPGLWASTLPLVFGHEVGPDELLPALLRAFGAHGLTSWTEFMRGPGARIVLEYALSHLQRRATDGESRPFDDRLVRLDSAFCRLESLIAMNALAPRTEISLDGGRLAWLEDVTDSPHLLIFDSKSDLGDYRCAVDARAVRLSRQPRIPHCRAYRATPTQLSSVEHAMAGLAGLRPSRDGLVRLERRDERGHRVDPSLRDVRAVEAACRLLGDIDRCRAA